MHQFDLGFIELSGQAGGEESGEAGASAHLGFQAGAGEDKFSRGHAAEYDIGTEGRMLTQFRVHTRFKDQLMNHVEISARRVKQRLTTMLAALAVLVAAASPARAQNPLMNCQDKTQQDPAKIFRSGIWKQWIYWMTPGPDAYAAVQRVVAEVNGARSAAGAALLVADPGYPLIVSVFDESNPRGANGSSAIATILSNQEVFLATFVDDTAGGSEVLFLTEAIRSNDALTTVKLVPGIAGVFDRSITLDLEQHETKVRTEWKVDSSSGDEIRFSASYPSSAIYGSAVSPASRLAFANCNLVSFSDLIYRSSPTRTYTLFDRSQANYVDVTRDDVRVRVRVRHHDRNINQMFNDRQNLPQLLIETDRVVRIESK